MRGFEFPNKLPRTALTDRVIELTEAGQARTALDDVLRVLRHEPANPEALWLALTVLTDSRTQHVQAAEPTTDTQRHSALFAPVAVQCTKCANVWYSNHPFLRGMSLGITNPVGLQCQRCRYSLCRGCLGWKPMGRPERPCPASGCDGTLTVPVLPTGRGDVVAIDPDDVEGVVVVRAGPVPPSMDEALMVVTGFVPLVPDDAPIIHIRRSEPGLMINETLAHTRLASSLVNDLELDGVLVPGAWLRATPLYLRPGPAVDDTDYLVVVIRRDDAPAPRRRLVHIALLREGTDQIGQDDMFDLLAALSPHAFHDRPTITGYPVPRWPDNCRDYGLALLARAHREYLADDYDIQLRDGRDGNRRWLLVEVFAF